MEEPELDAELPRSPATRPMPADGAVVSLAPFHHAAYSPIRDIGLGSIFWVAPNRNGTGVDRLCHTVGRSPLLYEEGRFRWANNMRHARMNSLRACFDCVIFLLNRFS